MHDAEDRQTPSAFELFQTVAAQVAGEFGHAFLHRLVRVLHGHMAADFAMLTVGDGTPPTRARTIYALDEGEPAEAVYDLKDTPCFRVYAGNEAVIASDLEALYPVEEGYHSYVAVPVRTGGQVRGHLAVLSETPLTNAATCLGMLRIFALRCETELQRLTAEAERERLIGDLMAQTDRLRKAHMTAREENTFKTRLLGIIAHDLRNPLAAILGQAELARALSSQATPVPERVDRALGKIESSVERMSSLIDATLTRVREDASALTLSRTPVDLAALLRMAVELNAPDAVAKFISIEIKGETATLAVDEELMLRAVDNLLSNAVKYTHPGGWVVAALHVRGEVVEIAVSDSGQGLTESDLARVFGRFETLSARPTAGESSTGLGLANVREIVEAHGGTIEAASEGQGRGATFTVQLPSK